MHDDQDVTIWEVYRLLQTLTESMKELKIEVQTRHHALAEKVNVAIGPLSVHGVQIAALEHRHDELASELQTVATKVDGIALKAAGLSGAIAAVGWIVHLLFAR